MKPHPLLLLSAVLALTPSSRAEVKVGDPFPVRNPAIGGALAPVQGKVAVVDFWASWCAPCRASFPAYGKLNVAYAPKGLAILAVSVDDSPEEYDRFVKKFSPPFPVTLDKGHALVGLVSVPTMPTCYVLDRHGRVRFMHAGYHGSETDESLRREIEQLISEN